MLESEFKQSLIDELNKRVEDKILEKADAEFLTKLINKADNDSEALKIAALGTTYKKTGLHFTPKLEETCDNRIRYFKKNEKLSFHTDDDENAPLHKLIIGDNYPALQNLLIQYKGKIDVIYIDPPYGKDKMGEFAKTNYNNAITRDNLLSMLYMRLKLAKQLLSDDGVIFCSIDDKNQAYVKCLFDDVFEEKNLITCFPKKGTGGRQDSTHFAIVHEYLICYAKEINEFKSGEIGINKKYKFYDEKKKLKYNTQLLRKWGDGSRRIDRPNLFYPIYYNEHSNTFSLEKGNNSIEIFPMLDEINEGRWRWEKSTMQEGFENELVEIQKKEDSYIPMERVYETPEEDTTKLYSSWIDDVDNSTGTSLLKKILPTESFGYPKATDYIFKILQMANVKDNSIILDFFAGSGTTGHAVLDYNSNYNKNSTFILCQLNEITDENPNGIAYDVTTKRLKRIMTGECYDGSKNFKWIEKNTPYGGNLDVYEISEVSSYDTKDEISPFEIIDETLYGKEKFSTIKEKIDWVCQNFENTQKILKKTDEE